MSKAYHIGRDQNSGIEWILCHRCGSRSYNQTDIDNHYCNGCHMFLDDPNAASQEIGRVGELVGGSTDAISEKAISDLMSLADKVTEFAASIIADCKAAHERCVSHFDEQVAMLTRLSEDVHEEAQRTIDEMRAQSVALQVKITKFTGMSRDVSKKMFDLRQMVESNDPPQPRSG